MEKFIYLDIDDTLADTTKHVIEYFNVKDFTINSKVSLIKNFMSVVKIWLRIKNDYSFWEHIPLKHDAFDIYETSLKITSNIHILTALPIVFYKKDTQHFIKAAQAKKNWVKKHFPNIPDENIHVVYAKEKHFMVKENPERFILVDDSKTNIKRWIKMGGTGIHVLPKNSNHLSVLNTHK